jgi:hypothetical protein
MISPCRLARSHTWRLSVLGVGSPFCRWKARGQMGCRNAPRRTQERDLSIGYRPQNAIYFTIEWDLTEYHI